MAQKFRKKPVEIEAVQWLGNNHQELEEFISVQFGYQARIDSKGTDVIIPTLEGDMRANPGDWIIRGVNGEFYPCKPDIFEKTYESVKNDCLIETIEKALAIELYPHQKEYILTGKPMPPDRQNGKTVAYGIKLALSGGEPLDMKKPETFCDMGCNYDVNAHSYARRYFKHEFLRIWTALKQAGLPVRTLKNL